MFQRDDRGFSLVEVVLAMFLLSVLALAILPLIIGATRLSVENEDLAAANSFASAQLAALREEFPTVPGAVNVCEDVLDYDGREELDPMGTGNTATFEVPTDTCPTDYPHTIDVSVTVRDQNGRELVVASSLILLSKTS